MMEERIIDFASLLRDQGIRVSVSENMDALQALNLLGVDDPLQFRTSLRCTLIKQPSDGEIFDRLFDLYFLGIENGLQEMDRRLKRQLGLGDEAFDRLLQEINRVLSRWEGNLSEMAGALLAGDLMQIGRLLREATVPRSADGRGGLRDASGYSPWAASRIEMDRLAAEFERFRVIARALDLDRLMIEEILRYLDQRLSGFTRLMEDLARRRPGPVDPDAASREELKGLAQKSFAYYTEDDLRRMKEAVTRLARRFKNLLSSRRRRATQGRFDVKRSLRKNLQRGGVPFEIELQRRRREKPEVIILCDISDSVLNAARFMLQFVYSMQDLYSKVRSFVFVSELGEVTPLFSQYPIDEAIDMAFKGQVIDVYTHSNFGRSFKIFHDQYLSAVTSRTTFLILGDGRNNYNLANDWVLEEIRRKAKRLIWLNPESRLTWGLGDSEMPRYMSHCDLVEECCNISQLSRMIDRMLV